MSGSRLRPYLGPVIALLVVLALGAGTVYAAIPNGDGKYYACRVKNTGAVRLINYPKVKTCPTGEKLISWNAKGPQGPAGPAGPRDQGDQGPAGPADWNAIPNIPAGFKDGVDEGDGYDSLVVIPTDQDGFPYQSVPAMTSVWLRVVHSPSVDVEATFIPATGCGGLWVEQAFFGRPSATEVYQYYLVNNKVGSACPFKMRVRAYNQNIAPAKLSKLADAVKVVASKKGPRP